MSSQPPTTRPIVHGKYIKNRTKAGKVTRLQMQRAVNYIGFGHDFEHPQHQLRGQWLGPAGAEDHADVVRWADQQAEQHKYTYTFILSLRDGVMQDSDFTQTLARLAETEESDFSADWRLMVHRDSDHDHAHLVVFRDRTLNKATLAHWRQQLQHDLAIREEQRLAEQMGREQSAEI